MVRNIQSHPVQWPRMDGCLMLFETEINDQRWEQWIAQIVLCCKYRSNPRRLGWLESSMAEWPTSCAGDFIASSVIGRLPWWLSYNKNTPRLTVHFPEWGTRSFLPVSIIIKHSQTLNFRGHPTSKHDESHDVFLHVMPILSANEAIGVCIALLASKKEAKSEDHWHRKSIYMGQKWKTCWGGHWKWEFLGNTIGM